ncbi:MAG: saccharopine dehydrogenase NADP-binding domain-containing protein [Gammaproteobacteria bacterium]|nr:saccharopine dehydrogenase NADP-binding domain-containing protein [Gammaproteobacteria bacterium]
MHIITLGGYGHFGGLLSCQLANESIHLTIAGRSKQKAEQFIQQNLTEATATISAVAIDAQDLNLAEHLRKLQADLVIYTIGPFQGQDYHVARSCILAGCHYLDLADARDYVANFAELDHLAKAHGVTALGGASTLPALSSAVIAHFLPHFQQLTHLDYAINLGNQTTRGEATVSAILSYCGKPFTTLIQNHMHKVYGWQNTHRMDFNPALGRCWVSNCDVPDLALFPTKYPTLQTQRFYAGLELGFLHLGLWGLTWLVRWRLISNLAAWCKPIIWLGERFRYFGSANSGMVIHLSGKDQQGEALNIEWQLLAQDNHGPLIPTIPALILARRLARGETFSSGAAPCIERISLHEFTQALAHLHIQQSVRYNGKAVDID